ncbi:uncharacterized protein LOC134191615 [Corticium candelabrum]|uniref:uncharacterized protein LOC134191615 n=1 Tax=Corticium candelabrum TaxID=121492 RepID=UPI002E26D1C1|nr:uncharacterized protein LOC134191615 [Corticium candelabrum]
MNKSQLNEQLQADYDETLQRLAEAEPTIDQLRFGVQTEVRKTVYYTLKEKNQRRESREGERRSEGPVTMATRKSTNQTTGRERSLSSSEDVISMSTATRGQRANVERTQYIEVNVEIIVTMIFTIAPVYHTVCE